MVPPRHEDLRALLQDDQGGGTLLALFILVIGALVGGGAVDMANARRVTEILQSNAEAAALSAAIRASEPVVTDPPRDVAERIARSGLRVAGLEDAWHDQSFEIGRLDAESGTFLPGAAPVDAVRVTLHRDAAHGNPEPLLFARYFGHAPWNLRGQAVAQIRTRPNLACPDPLLSLQTRVDVSDLDLFLGLCVMANAGLSYGDRPIWKNGATDALLNGLLTEGVVLPGLELLGLQQGLSEATLRHAAATATQHVSLRDLDDLRVISDGSLYVSCEEDEVLRLGEGFVVENAAIWSECPIRFDGEVTLRASLVVSNLTSLLQDLDQVSLRPDAVLTGSPACRPGNGVRVLVFVDLDALANVPALISTSSPLGQYLDHRVAEAGGLVSDLLGLVGGLVNPLVRQLSQITTNLQLLPICLNAETMLNGDTVVLR